MNGTRGSAMQTHEDLFVIRSRIAADHARVRAENAARAIQGVRVEGGARTGGRAWLGRQLIAVGSALAGDPPPDRSRGATGRPC
jgi:hypothetical protein